MKRKTSKLYIFYKAIDNSFFVLHAGTFHQTLGESLTISCRWLYPDHMDVQKLISRRDFTTLLPFVAGFPVMFAGSREKSKYVDAANFQQFQNRPIGAYSFGLVVQDLVRQRDLEGLFSLVDGELSNGPRKRFVAGKSYEEIFDEKWTDVVLSEQPESEPVGWRGYMLGRGMIWYDYFESTWSIFSINRTLAPPEEQITFKISPSE